MNLKKMELKNKNFLVGTRGLRSALVRVRRSSPQRGSISRPSRMCARGYPQERRIEVPGAGERQATTAYGYEERSILSSFRRKPPTFGVLCKGRERRYSERTGQQAPIMKGTLHPIHQQLCPLCLLCLKLGKKRIRCIHSVSF